MAGDFVMVEFATRRKPEVLRIASVLGVPQSHAFGLCVTAWMWFDEQTEDGHARGVTLAQLDEIVGHAGFAQALHQVDWLVVREGALQLPNFDRLMGQSAKKRAKDNKRQRKHRHGGVTKVSRAKCDISVTKEEKRKEDNKPLYPLSGFSHAFQMAWDLWPPKRRSKKEAAQTGWNEAVARLQIRHGGDHRKAEDWLFDRVREFVKSPKAGGRYCTGIANWLTDGHYDDAAESWEDSGEEPAQQSAYQEIERV